MTKKLHNHSIPKLKKKRLFPFLKIPLFFSNLVAIIFLKTWSTLFPLPAPMFFLKKICSIQNIFCLLIRRFEYVSSRKHCTEFQQRIVINLRKNSSEKKIYFSWRSTLIGMSQGTFTPLVILGLDFVSRISKLFWRWKLRSIGLIWHPAKLIESYKTCS